MVPLYQARISDLGPDDIVIVECGARRRLPAELTADNLATAGIKPDVRVLDLEWHLRCRDCGERGRAGVSVRWAHGG